MRTLYYSRPHNDNPTYLKRLESEHTWLLNKIEEVTRSKLPHRARATREIRDLTYQLRRNELELAFNGPEWVKYEKYAMWEALTM